MPARRKEGRHHGAEDRTGESVAPFTTYGLPPKGQRSCTVTFNGFASSRAGGSLPDPFRCPFGRIRGAS
jgi:hypothetical protein